MLKLNIFLISFTFISAFAGRPIMFTNPTGGPAIIEFTTPPKNSKELITLIKIYQHDYQALLPSNQLNEIKKRYNAVTVNSQRSFQNKYNQWKTAYIRKLKDSSQKYPDNELEYLLHLRYFKKPLKTTRKTWRESQVLNFFYRVSGLQDVQHAIPLNTQFSLKEHQQDLTPPAPLQLPKVPQPNKGLKKNECKLASLISRDYYYIEFPNIASMKSSLEFVSKTFQKWSPGVYPKAFHDIIFNELDRIGIPYQKMLKDPQKYGRIVIAGRDPYFQSGTNVLFLIEKGLKGFLNENGVTIASSSQVLMKKRFDDCRNNRSLADDPHYLYTRHKLKKSTKEKFFMFISDYWLTSFLSPKWQILSSRLAECDARIRLTEILRLLAKSEQGLNYLPGLNMLKELYKGNSSLQWIMRDLKVDDDKIVHKEYGGLYNHTPIDELTFSRVSSHEKREYELFKRSYFRRWREMDPLGLQVNQEKDHYSTKLYISPISTLSEYRSYLRDVLPVKESHTIRDIANTAFGVSLQLKWWNLTNTDTEPQSIAFRGFDLDISTLTGIDIFSLLMDLTKQPIALEVPKKIYEGQLKSSRVSPSSDPDFDIINLFGPFFVTKENSQNVFIAKSKELLRSIIKPPVKTIKTSNPSDLYFYFNFENAPKMMKAAKEELIIDRINDSKRINDRQRRILATFGENLEKGIFPASNPQYFTSRSTLAPLLLSEFKKYEKALPEIIDQLKKVEAFVSIEPNAILFESKIYFKGPASYPKYVRERSKND